MSVLQESKWYLIASVSEFPLGEGKRVQFQDYDLAVFRLSEDSFKAIDQVCPHQQGPLADGMVVGESVFCPLHALKMDLNSGCALNGEGKVKAYPVRVAEGKVYIAFEQGKVPSE